MNELVPLWRRALTVEICWLDRAGDPAALVTTPLLAQGIPCVALPYARADEVASLRHAEQAAFAVTDSRSLRPGIDGRVVIGAIQVLDDLEGKHFAAELLPQELVKYPPSRSLADSPLLRRENWWWLPRILIRLVNPIQAYALSPRTNPARHGLLTGVRDAALRLETVDVADSRQQTVRLHTMTGQAGNVDRGPGLIVGYDYSIPDLERWETWSLHGTLDHDELVVTQRSGDPEAGLAPLPLLQRVRRQHTLSRRCRRNIRAAEQGG